MDEYQYTGEDVDKSYGQGYRQAKKEVHKILNECIGNDDMAMLKIRKWLYEEQKESK